MLVLALKTLIFAHVFIFKGQLQFIILKWFQEITNEALNLYKLFLLFYNILYLSLGNHFLLIFFKDIIYDSVTSINMIIFLLKFLYTGLFSVKTFNILTSSLFEGYAWISFSIYIYSLICIYTNINPIKDLMKNLFPSLDKNESLEKKGFNNLKAGIILEVNIVIMLRVFTFQLMPYFFTRTAQYILYVDCSMKAKNTVDIYEINLITLSCLQVLMAFGIFLFMIKKKKIMFNLQIEEGNIFQRMLFFLAIYTYVDSNLQNYISFDNSK